jgi:hypothetical protein
VVEKECPYCECRFKPDPRVGKRQKACGKKRCLKKRHDESHLRWRTKNPDAYEGRYSLVRRWLDENEEYLAKYRADHPDYVKADNKARQERRRREKERRADIQDERLRREIESIGALRGADIQDTIRQQIAGILVFLKANAALGRADIQDSIA